MLLIDGVRYDEWKPASESAFEQIVKEHAEDIFGEQSIYIDIKHKLKSKSGIGSIPDGYVIVFREQPCWHIVEIELSSHPLYDHIVPQVSRFINGMKNPSTQRETVDTLYQEISSDDFRKLRLKNAIGTAETYKFVSDILSKPPTVTIIIEKHTEQLDEAISALAHSQIKVVELQTFARADVGLGVHAHMFEPLYKTREFLTAELVSDTIAEKRKVTSRRVTLQDLVDAKLVNPGQRIFRDFKGNRYEAEVTATSKLGLLHDNTTWNTLSAGAEHITGTAIDGWKWWYTLKDGRGCLMDELRKKLHL